MASALSADPEPQTGLLTLPQSPLPSHPCGPIAPSRPKAPFTCQTASSPRVEVPPASSDLKVTMHTSVPSVPPEAVNMSLGLSMAATTNPFQLLVSCPASREHPERMRGDLGLWCWGSRGGWGCWDGRVRRTTLPTKPLCPQACGPTVHHACRENMHLTGICFLLASPFRQVKRIPAALQGECLGPLSPLRNLHASDRGLPWGQEHSYQSG